MEFFRPLVVLLLSVIPALSATFGTPVQHPAALVDLAYDAGRSRLYVLSPLDNTVQIYNTTAKPPTPISGGTIAVVADPIALAVSRDGNSLYVACYNSGVL